MEFKKTPTKIYKRVRNTGGSGRNIRKTMAERVWVFLFSLLVFHLCEGLYFNLHETENKCFLEEVPSETMIVGTVESPVFCVVWLIIVLLLPR